jgi:radical SAM modification target selenobiotic family peptide
LKYPRCSVELRREEFQFNINLSFVYGGERMDLKDIKKALAGVCVATLLSGAGLTLTGCASG